VCASLATLKMLATKLEQGKKKKQNHNFFFFFNDVAWLPRKVRFQQEYFHCLHELGDVYRQSEGRRPVLSEHFVFLSSAVSVSSGLNQLLLVQEPIFCRLTLD